MTRPRTSSNLRIGAVRIASVVVAGLFAQCTLTTSLDGLSGGPDAMGRADAAPGDAALYPDVPDGGCLCTDAPPPGWQGPVELAEAVGGAAAACADAYGAELFAGTADPAAPPAECGCSACTAPTGQTCPSGFSVTLHAQTTCSTVLVNQALTVGGCWNVSGSAAQGVTSTPPAPSAPGTCQTQGTTTVPPAAWGRSARVCSAAAPPGTSVCAARQVCVAPPRPPFQPRLCVVADGATACPAGSPYAVQHVYFTGASDTRGCTSCSCSPATGTVCAGTFRTFDSVTCAVQTGSYPLTSACTSLAAPPAGMTLSALTPSGGSCALVGGQPTGAFAPSGAKTVCCLP
jgi:hypothetical protein